MGVSMKVSKKVLFWSFIVCGLLAFSFQNCSNRFQSENDIKSFLGANNASTVNYRSSKNFSSEASADFEATVANCSQALYSGWKCYPTTVISAEGRPYNIEFRWNHLRQSAEGTAVWVLGNNGTGSFRGSDARAAQIQDDLDKQDNIRTIEIAFTDPVPADFQFAGGYWSTPNGYRSAAGAYMAALDHLHAKGLVHGKFLNHVGGSNGTMVAAYALAHLNAEKYLDRVVFHAGPFIPDFTKACDSNYWASFSKSPQQLTFIKQLWGHWMAGDKTKDPCTAGGPDRSSTLKGGKNIFPTTAVHVVMGALEATTGFGPWMLLSNLDWYSQIVAPEKSRIVRSDIGHEMSWSDIRDYLKRPPPQPLVLQNPQMIFSLTKNGAQITELPLDNVIYGRVTGVPESGAAACMEFSGEDTCSNPNNWTNMPNTDWRYVGANTWQSEFKFSSAQFSAGQIFRGFWINTNTGERTAAHQYTATGAQPVKHSEPIPPPVFPNIELTFSNSYNGPATQFFRVGQTLYGRVSGATQQAMACASEIKQNPNFCDSLSNFKPLAYWNAPGAEWTFNSATGLWNIQMAVTANFKNLRFKGQWFDPTRQKYSNAIYYQVD